TTPQYGPRALQVSPKLSWLAQSLSANDFKQFEYLDSHGMFGEEQQAIEIVVAAMRVLLLRTLAPKRVAGVGGLLECQCCGGVAITFATIRHRNCLWMDLHSD